MNNTFQTSFIPKKPIDPLNNKRHNPIGIFPVVATISVLVMVLSAIGLFFYKGYLIKQKDNFSVSLSKIKDSFEQDTIKDLELFDKRTSAAKDVLDSHIVLSPMFNLLGELTIPSIQYTEFKHQTTDKGFQVKISGISRDYRSIALQADVFNGAKGRYFKSVIFSNLVKNEDNYVTFSLEFNVDPSLLSYENSLLLNQSQTEDSSNPLLDNTATN